MTATPEMVWVRCGRTVADDLLSAGLTKPEDVTNASPANQVPPTPLQPPAPTAPPIAPTAPTFIVPKWYPLLSWAMKATRGCMLNGPRGSGKTTALIEYARSNGRPLFGTTAFDGIDAHDLIGTTELVESNGATVTRFVPGPLPLALEADGIFYLEEADRAKPSLLSMLNTLTDGSGHGLNLPDGRVLTAGSEFRVALTFNPGPQYGGRGMNFALRSRLMPIFCDYPEQAIEEQMLRQHVPSLSASNMQGVLSVAALIRKDSASHGFDLSIRELSRWCRLVLEGVEPDWRKAYQLAVVDLASSPADDTGVRAVLEAVATACGMDGWT